jgi:hypothetical protein
VDADEGDQPVEAPASFAAEPTRAILVLLQETRRVVARHAPWVHARLAGDLAHLLVVRPPTEPVVDLSDRAQYLQHAPWAPRDGDIRGPIRLIDREVALDLLCECSGSRGECPHQRYLHVTLDSLHHTTNGEVITRDIPMNMEAQWMITSMIVTFTRHRGKRDHVRAVRSDGSSIEWDFPSHDARLPHDLCHLIVEDALHMVDGFWGLVDRGVDVRVVDDRAELLLDGRPLTEHPDADFAGLMKAEEVVALLSPTGMRTEQTGGLLIARFDASPDAPAMEQEGLHEIGFELPAAASADAIAAIHQRLSDLAREWQALRDGDSITLAYGASAR